MSTIPKTGPEAIAYALSQLDMKKLEEQAKADIRSGKKTKQNRAVAVLNILRGMDRNQQTPRDYMISKVPVIPAQFRPFAVQGNTFIPGDANVLYKDLFDVLDAHNAEREMFGDENAGRSRLSLYDAIRALYGYGEPTNPKTSAKQVKGYLSKLTGSTAKFSFAVSKMMAKTQDNVGRSTIIVDPELSIDQIGIPKDMALTMYAPYVQGELKARGFSDADALQAIKDKSPDALMALEQVGTKRPVIYSRAPAWHAFNVLGGKPKFIDGNAISINPYVTTGLNADFDGDDQVNTVLLRIFFNQDVKKVLTSDPTLWYSMPMFKDISIHTVENSIYQGAVHLESFPHGEFSNRVEGKNGPIDFYHVPDGIMVLAHDKETNNLVWKQVKYWSVHHDREVEIVNLDYDMQIITDNDPRAVYGIAKDSSDLEVRRFTPTDALKHGVCVPFVKDASSVCKESFKAITIPGVGAFPLTFETGELLGILCGDGWWDKKDYDTAPKAFSGRAINIADSEEWNADAVMHTLEQLFGDVRHYKHEFTGEASGRYGSTCRHTYRICQGSEVTKWLTSVLGGEKTESSAGAATKHLPAFHINAPVEFREGLLCGLIDTDGTICTSHAKGKPQLMIAFTSTSIRLCQEVKLLCSSLGIQSKISFSKTTAAGNAAYIVTISAVDAKQSGVFSRMCHVRKRDIFCNTHVSTDRCNDKKNKIPFPECVSNTIRKWMFSPKVTETALAGLPKEEADWRVRCATVYHSVVAGCNTGMISRGVVQDVVDLFEDAYERRKEDRAAGIAFFRNTDGRYTDEDNKVVRAAFYAIAPKEGDAVLYKEADKCMHRCAVPLRNGTISDKVRSSLLAWLEAHEASRGCLDDTMLMEWKRRFVDSDSLAWASVVSVEKTGHKETGYDLTVPGYETFTSADGIILSNTINVHVPSTDEAVEETYEKFMPSRTVMSNRVPGKVVNGLKQEQVLGLYEASSAPKTRPFVFRTEEEAIGAIRRGQIPLDADVEVQGRNYSQYGQEKEASKKENKNRPPIATVDELLKDVSPEDRHLLGLDFAPKLKRLQKALWDENGEVVYSYEGDSDDPNKKVRLFRWDTPDGEMEAAYVRPEDRGKGYGKMLVHQSPSFKTKVKIRNGAMKHILENRWQFDSVDGDHENWKRKPMTDEEKAAKDKFKEIISAYKELGFSPDRKLRLLYTDYPAVMGNGSPVLDDLKVNSTTKVNSDTSGGSQTAAGKIYINSNPGRVLKSLGIANMTPDEFVEHIMGHEIAHDISSRVLTDEQKQKLLADMRLDGYNSMYADGYDPVSQKAVRDEEYIAEYLSNLNKKHRKAKTGQEKEASEKKEPVTICLKGCKQDGSICVKQNFFRATIPDKNLAEAAMRIAKAGNKDWLCRMVTKHCGIKPCQEWKIVDFNNCFVVK